MDQTNGVENLLTPQMGLFSHRAEFNTLNTRRAPIGSGLLLEPLLAWCSPQMRKGGKALVQDANLPDIFREPFNGSTRLVACETPSRHANGRFRIAKTMLNEDGIAATPAQLLTPAHLIVLSHLIALLRHGDTVESTVLAESASSIGIGFRPRYLLQRAGLVTGALYGAAYDRLEQLISDLARIRISYAEKEHGEWVTRSVGGFFDIFCSGGRHDVFRNQLLPSSQANQRRNGARQYRDQNWKVLLSQPLISLLQSVDTSNITAVTPAMLHVSRRSSIAQWLVLFYAGHGHDGQMIYERRLDTLCNQMFPHLTPTRARSTRSSVKNLSSLDAFKAFFDQRTAEKSPPYELMQRIVKNVQRLHKKGFFAECRIAPGNDLPSDLRHRSRLHQPGDKICVQRHASIIETALPRLSESDRASRWFASLKNTLKKLTDGSEALRERLGRLLSMPRKGFYALSMLRRLMLAIAPRDRDRFERSYYAFRLPHYQRPLIST